MPDAIYTDRVLAALYDSLNPSGADTDFYCALAREPSRILDLGCGTGLLTVRLASQGHAVTGLDPAQAMLDIACRREGADQVSWILGDITALPPDSRFDLVLMTGHVFQVFLDDIETVAVLSAVKKSLAPGGRLVFESRNPLARAWENWEPDRSRRTVEHPDLGLVETWHDVTDVSDGQVTFRTHTHLTADGRIETSESRLAFRSRAEIDALMRLAGLTDMEWQGNWDGAPLCDESPEIIVVAS